jgi:hypothetical protein
MRAALAAMAVLCLGACASLPPVQPWQKRALAQPSMRFDGNRQEADFRKQLYAAKEGASGGDGVGAGGCGCN